MVRQRSGFSALLMLGVVTSAACNDDVVEPPELDPPALTPATQWAGGTVRLEWEAIEVGGTAPSLTADGVALVPLAGDEGWVDYRLPTTARGPVRIALEGVVTDTFDVNVLGFRSSSDLDIGLAGNLLVWPRTGPASVVGAPGDASGVVQVLPGSNSTEYLLEDAIDITSTGVRSVGPTYDADLLLLPRGSTPEVWRLLPAPQVVDTLTGTITRHAMLLSDSIYVQSGQHNIWSYNLRAGTLVDWGQYEETRGAVVSPDGRHGAFRVNGSASGPPVINGLTGEMAFHVDTLFRSYGVDFSPTGDTLYIAGIGRSSPHPELLLAIDVMSGDILETIDLGAREAINIVRDRDSHMLYVVAAVLTQPNDGTVIEEYSGDTPVLLAIDSRTMQVVGEAASTGFDHCAGWCEGTVTVGTDGVFFVMTGSPARLLSFDVLPD